ncbi:hypothetical protein [Chryseobacterium caseinilyticum]|uniref:Uncharacterized protein n=1 Tax=Chryseobacterium caseinilyticum TaxID=2771428 RepID=A0ABR8Z854_9FLAO|nr:hypothetical protein [Chryseobacterium caseinilyticum]MBD8081451.1 hypothetical protein [Chryseobacterium caseinilyticum]
MEYHAIAEKYTDFKVTKDGKPIGQLNYKSWFKFSAEIEIANSKYQVEPKGFWGTTVEVLDGKKVILQFTMNWDGNIVMKIYLNDIEKNYTFSHKGFFRESFVLTDEKGSELLMMKPHVQWRSLNYEYQIYTSEILETFEEKNILLLISLHCANYYMAMMMGMGV